MVNSQGMKIQIMETSYKAQLLWQKFYLTTNLMEKVYYLQLVNFQLQKMYYLIYKLENCITNEKSRSMKEFTSEELKSFNGTNNNLAYVAVNNVVYDVTQIKSWKNGDHFGVKAGKDVTIEYENCHGGDEKLKKLAVVGKLI
jgi:predicted heme/steroid binding protein